MPDLRNWIEAQLKRGYTRKQIKALLIRKGYPPTAVAEVDKINIAKTSRSGNNNHKNFSYTPFIVIIIIMGVLVLMFSLPLFSKKPSSQVIPSGEESAVGEKVPIKSQEPESLEQVEEPKKSENNFCVGLLPENMIGIPIKEYILNYNIDGSKGNIVKWIASEQPLETFSPFDSPKIFFVYDNNTFEGCGYLEKLENAEKNNEFKSAVKSQLILCNDKELFLNKKNQDSYNEISLYHFKSEEEIIHTVIFAALPFNDEATILTNLRCKP